MSNCGITPWNGMTYFRNIYYVWSCAALYSNILNPVAISSTEMEFNEACLVCMATTHLKFLEDRRKKFKFHNEKSAVEMGPRFRDTFRARHMMTRYHYSIGVVESAQ
jgi:hypothetical protein